MFYLNLGLIIFQMTFSGQDNPVKTFEEANASLFYSIILERDDEVIIDVRTWKEFKKCRLENASLAETSDFLKDIVKDCLPETPLLVYCEDGDRSRQACILLVDMGFTNVYNLSGGLNEWIENDYPLDRTRAKKNKK